MRLSYFIIRKQVLLMQFADLHIHSTYSDGCLTPKEIVSTAYGKGIRYISITDHDTIESQCEITEHFNGASPSIIPGIEISTEYKGHEIHILGYFIDIRKDNLVDTLQIIRSSRINRAMEIISELRKIGISISNEDIEINKFVSVGRPHIAKILVEKGYSANVKEAFRQFLTKGKPGYVERFKLSFKEALSLIKASNGISVLAHPGEIYEGLNIETVILDLKAYGLIGIEVFHPAHGEQKTSKFYNLAKKYRLIITGGSDCHGNLINGSINMGLTGLNEILTNKLLLYNKYK